MATIRVEHLGGGAAEELNFKLVGFKELEARLKAMPRKIENKCFRAALRKAATKVAKKLRAGTPVGATGRAKKSVKVKVKVRRGGAYARIGYTKRPAAYIAMGDRGTRHQPPRTFFKAATAGWERDANRDFSDALKQAVETAEGIAV